MRLMSVQNDTNSACGSCPNSDKCRDAWAHGNEGPLNSSGLVLSSIAAFILPLIMAIIVGSLTGSYAHPDDKMLYQIAGSFAGLIVGGLIAYFIVRYLKEKFPAESNCKDQLEGINKYESK